MKKLLWIAILGISCSGPAGEAGHNSLITTTDEAPGPNCPGGGTKIQIGIDTNGDGQLSASETLETRFVCNGTNGLTGLTAMTDEPPGNNCSAGGYKFQVGLDSNSNFVLDSTEVQATKYICNKSQAQALDKVEMIGIHQLMGFGSGNNTVYRLSPYPDQIIKFNKLDYLDVDSITFVAMIAACNPLNQGACPLPRNIYAELFNVTDSVSIDHTEQYSEAIVWDFKESKNIYSDLPGNDITLGVRIRTDYSPSEAQLGGYYVFIYRH